MGCGPSACVGCLSHRSPSQPVTFLPARPAMSLVLLRCAVPHLMLPGTLGLPESSALMACLFAWVRREAHPSCILLMTATVEGGCWVSTSCMGCLDHLRAELMALPPPMSHLILGEGGGPASRVHVSYSLAVLSIQLFQELLFFPGAVEGQRALIQPWWHGNPM